MENDLIKYNFESKLTKANYVKAAEYAKLIKTAEKTIEKTLRPCISAAHKAHKVMLNTLKEQLADYERIECSLKGKFAEFHVKHPQLKVDGVVFVDTLTPVIVDEKLVPEKYKSMQPDIAKIKEAIKSDGMLFQCPGISVRQDIQVKFYADKD